MFTVIGFGTTENLTKSDVLLKTNLPFVSHSECSRHYRILINAESTICAGGEVSDSAKGGRTLNAIETTKFALSRQATPADR